MKNKIVILLIFLLSLFTVQVSAATPPDIIHEMDAKITPQTDGSLNINYTLDYEATTDFPADTQYLEIGVPNEDFSLVDYSHSSLVSSAYEKKSGTSQVHLDFSKLPKKGDRFKIEFTINQRSMMYKAGSDNVSFEFRPGWFDFAVINKLKVILNTENISPLEIKPDSYQINSAEKVWITENMEENQKAESITVIYPRSAFPELKDIKDDSSSVFFIIGFIIVLVIIIILIISKLSGVNDYKAGRYGGGYKGGSFLAGRPLNRGGGIGCACA